MSDDLNFEVPDNSERARKALFTDPRTGTEHTIPERFSAAEAVMFSTAMRRYGTEHAVSFALEYALGPDSFQVLMDLGSDPKNDETFRRVAGIVVAEISGKAYAVAPGKASPAKKPSSRRRTTSAKS